MLSAHLHTHLSGIIQTPHSPARGKRSGQPSTERQIPLFLFLSCKIQFEYTKKEKKKKQAAGRMQEWCMVGDFYRHCLWVVPKLIPRKSGPYIDHIGSYLSCCLMNWKRGAVHSYTKAEWVPKVGFSPPPPPPPPRPALPHLQDNPWVNHLSGAGGEGERENIRDTISTCSLKESLTLAIWCFPALELCVNGHMVFTRPGPLLRTAQYDFTTRVTSPGEASANGYHTREVWRASIPSHSPKYEKKKKRLTQAVKFKSTPKSLLWSLDVSEMLSQACVFLSVSTSPG